MATTGLGGKKGGVIVVKLAPRIPVLPGRRLVEDVVAIPVLDKLGARRDGVFNQQILRRRAVHRQMHGQRISDDYGAFQRVETVDDLPVFGDGRQLEVVAGQVERERALLVELLLGRIVLALDRPVGAPTAMFAHLHNIATGFELGGSHIEREVGAGGSVRRGEMPLADSTAVEQHIHIEVRVQLL